MILKIRGILIQTLSDSSRFFFCSSYVFLYFLLYFEGFHAICIVTSYQNSFPTLCTARFSIL